MIVNERPAPKNDHGTPPGTGSPAGTVDAAIGALGILARRKIEAEIIKPIYEEMVARFGREAARAVLEAAITRAAIESGQRLAAAEPGPTDLSTFAALQPKWRQDGALEVEILAETPTRFDYDVTRCRYAEMYHAMGLGEIGDILSCRRDATFCQGYDARIRMERSTTIMQGAARCDFRYGIAAEER